MAAALLELTRVAAENGGCLRFSLGLVMGFRNSQFCRFRRRNGESGTAAVVANVGLAIVG